MILAIVLSLALLVADRRGESLGALRSAVAVLVYPLQMLADLPIRTALLAQDRLADERRLRGENAALRQEHLLLGARLQRFEALEAENRRLRDLLGSSFKADERVLIAEIVQVDLADSRQQFVLNKGSTSGVFVGQPVLDADAVMGQVIRTSPFSSVVLLVTDPEHALPVQVNRHGLRSIAAGTGASQELELRHIPKNADIRVGDLLVTSGLGGRFPAGYPVGRVATVGYGADSPFATVTATPSAHPDRAREVLLVWTFDPERGGDGASPAAAPGGPAP